MRGTVGRPTSNYRRWPSRAVSYLSRFSHLVRMSQVTNSIPEEIDEMLTDLSVVAKKNGKALELNGNDIDYNPRLVRLLASACSKTRCLVSVGSDAHYPKDVFRNVDLAIRLVDEFKLELA